MADVGTKDWGRDVLTMTDSDRNVRLEDAAIALYRRSLASGTAPAWEELKPELATASLAEKQEAARRLFRESLAHEQPLTGRVLGGAFGLSPRWGSDRAREVRESAAAAVREASGASGDALVAAPSRQAADAQPAGERSVSREPRPVAPEGDAVPDRHSRGGTAMTDSRASTAEGCRPDDAGPVRIRVGDETGRATERGEVAEGAATSTEAAAYAGSARPRLRWYGVLVLFLVALVVTALGVLGAINSFAKVESAVEPSFGELAWTVPLVIDLSIAALTALELMAVYLDFRIRWLRPATWALAACTVYLNVQGETGVGAAGHAATLGVWVIAIEAARAFIQAWAGLANESRARARRDRIRLARWLLAPISTARLWRRMVLWELPFGVALRLERQRILAQPELGWFWWLSRRKRARYKLGDFDAILGEVHADRDRRTAAGSVGDAGDAVARAAA